MKIYEFTEPGFDGGTDETDHLVKWIAAERFEDATAYAALRGWEYADEVDLGEGLINTATDDELDDMGVNVVLR